MKLSPKVTWHYRIWPLNPGTNIRLPVKGIISKKIYYFFTKAFFISTKGIQESFTKHNTVGWICCLSWRCLTLAKSFCKAFTKEPYSWRFLHFLKQLYWKNNVCRYAFWFWKNKCAHIYKSDGKGFFWREKSPKASLKAVPPCTIIDKFSKERLLKCSFFFHLLDQWRDWTYLSIIDVNGSCFLNRAKWRSHSIGLSMIAENCCWSWENSQFSKRINLRL